jgi:hypothetical protein
MDLASNGLLQHGYTLEGYAWGTTVGIPRYESRGRGPQSYFQVLRSPSQYPMSTYSAIQQATGSSHPLDGRLGVYCWSKIPRVSWAAGYGPKLLDTTSFL